MTKRKFINLTLGLAVAISPLAVVMACANSPKDETVNQTKPTTIKQNKFLASDFNFNQPIDEVQKLINEEWILAKKQLLLNNSEQLTGANQILNLNVSKNQTVLNVSFQLASGSYVDQNGQVGSQVSSVFSFQITNFSPSVQPDQPELIDLDLVMQQATFDVENKATLKPSQVQTEQLKWNQQANQSNINFKVISLLPDDQNGKLGFQVVFSQKDLPSNVKTLSVRPNEDRAISGFITSPSQPNHQTILDQEIARLNQEVAQVISLTKLTTVEIANYQDHPDQFKQKLANLKPGFTYDVTKFSVTKQSNQNLLTIELFVQYQSANTTITLSKPIEVVNVDLNDPNWLIKSEQNRLNHLSKNSIFLKTTFSESEVSAWRQNPNQALEHLFNFVSTFGFHYQVQQLDFKEYDAQTNQAKLRFKIAAKFWKNPNQPIIKSNEFIFNVVVNKDGGDEIQPPASGNWLVEPSKLVTTDPNDPEQQVLTIDLNQDTQLDFANYENADSDKIDLLMMKIFAKTQSQFVNVSGNLPDDYWNKYTTISFEDEIKNDKNQLIGYVYTFQFEYTNGQNLDDWFNIKATITNGYNSGKAPAKPSADQVWNDLITKFSDLITKQAIDDDKLHLDWSGNGIYSFAQLGYDNPSKSEHFSNFLNFSPTQFGIENQHLVSVVAKDATINYLTNTIKFTWELTGRNNPNLGINLSGFRKEFTNQVIKYQPSGKWIDTIKYNENDPDLQINNSFSLNHLLDRFGLANKFVSEQNLKDKFKAFGTNWTWKARELVNYLRFTFYQAFNDGADAINMAILGIDPNQVALDQNPQNYTLVLKARLNQQAQGTYLPYLQQFGAGINASQRAWKSGDIIEIRLNVNSIPETPDVVKSANEILPGLAPGNVLGTGQGAEQAYLNSPPRNDIYSIALGSNVLNIKVNGQSYVTNLSANHRFIAFNLLSRYDFKDLVTPEPTPEAGWTSGNI